MAPTEAYPLTWPSGRPRTAYPERSAFDCQMGRSIKDVQDEVRRLGGTGLVISSNLPVRRDGMPYADAAQPRDKGVAVYFMYKRKPMCFACDRWNRIQDNMRAIAKTIDALRGIERWGTGQMVQQAFTGFVALPAPEQPWQVLELPHSKPTLDDIEKAYRQLAAKHHPDRGGDSHQMARINAARDELLRGES